MAQFICKKEGFIYYDPILSVWSTIDNDMLFIVGYSRALCDSRPSNRLTIPSFFIKNSVPIHYVEDDVRKKIKEILSRYHAINYTDAGYYIEIYGLSNVLDSIGLAHFYRDLRTGSVLYEPHVPLFTLRSYDYNRVLTILNDDYFHSPSEDPREGVGSKYTVVNSGTDRYKYIDLYGSFGSSDFMNNVLYSAKEVIDNVDSYSSYFIWNSLAFDQLYQFSLGVLYGLVQLGYGILPFVARPSTFLPDDLENIELYDEAHFWFQNARVSDDCRNSIFEPDRGVYRYNTYPGSGLRIGITDRVERGLLSLSSRFMWGYSLDVTDLDVSEQSTTNKISFKVDLTYNEGRLCSFLKTSTVVDDEVTIDWESSTRVKIGLDVSSSHLYSLEIKAMDDGSNVVSFVYEPVVWPYPDELPLPTSMYEVSYIGSIRWNSGHPLLSYLYGKPFSAIYDKTEIVTIYNVNSNSETSTAHSLSRDLYELGSSWLTEQELNDLGWRVQTTFVYDAANRVRYNAYIDPDNETISYNGVTEPLSDFYLLHLPVLGIVRRREDVEPVLKDEDYDIVAECYYDSHSNLHAVDGYESEWLSREQLVSMGYQFIDGTEALYLGKTRVIVPYDNTPYSD